jgi:hypothetical protein
VTGVLILLSISISVSEGETLMPATPVARAHTRDFARVIGPFLVIVPAIIAVRAPNLGTIVSAFFENEALVWITGRLLLFGGLLIIAHQYWSGLSAIRAARHSELRSSSYTRLRPFSADGRHVRVGSICTFLSKRIRAAD